MPRCNEVGRTLGGRDKDKMTDCPMVLALPLEGKSSGSGRRAHTLPHSHTNAGTTMHEKDLGCSWWLISEQARAVVVV